MQNETSSCSEKIWQPDMQQRVFRSLLDGYSYPGRISTCPDPDTTAWLAILVSLLDGETTLADPQLMVDPALWPKLETHRSGAEKAAFIVTEGALPVAIQPCIGTLEAPETGATILLRVASLLPAPHTGLHLTLRGPGIATNTAVHIEGLHPDWITARAEWVCAFPLGVELVLCDEHRFVAIPEPRISLWRCQNELCGDQRR